jgi:hypothetical protein
MNQIMEDTLQNKIKKSLQKFVGEENNVNTRLQIGNKIAEICENNLPVCDLKINKSIDMWSDMNFKEKALWFICNKLFKIIGRSYRKLYQDYTLSKLRISEDSLQFKLPRWMESHPKSILICDITYSPVIFTKSVNINL